MKEGAFCRLALSFFSAYRTERYFGRWSLVFFRTPMLSSIAGLFQVFNSAERDAFHGQVRGTIYCQHDIFNEIMILFKRFENLDAISPLPLQIQYRHIPHLYWPLVAGVGSTGNRDDSKASVYRASTKIMA